MGKLAQRLADPLRSGVYRIVATQALEEAAALNRFSLLTIALDGGSGDTPASCGALASALADASRSPAPGHVFVLRGFEALSRAAPGALESLLEALEDAARARRAAGKPFFAAFLDPSCALPSLAPLYNWHPK